MLRFREWLACIALAVLVLSSAAYAGDPVRGVIRTIDTAASTVTLEDGTELSVPSQDIMAKIHEGDTIEAMYEDNDGRKVVSSVEVTGQ